MDKEWTSTAITRDRLNGLKLEAEKNRRSIGQQLESFLGELGVRKLSDEQYMTEIRRLKK
jgi:hypothetical protein